MKPNALLLLLLSYLIAINVGYAQTSHQWSPRILFDGMDTPLFIELDNLPEDTLLIATSMNFEFKSEEDLTLCKCSIYVVRRVEDKQRSVLFLYRSGMTYPDWFKSDEFEQEVCDYFSNETFFYFESTPNALQGKRIVFSFWVWATKPSDKTEY